VFSGFTRLPGSPLFTIDYSSNIPNQETTLPFARPTSDPTLLYHLSTFSVIVKVTQHTLEFGLCYLQVPHVAKVRLMMRICITKIEYLSGECIMKPSPVMRCHVPEITLRDFLTDLRGIYPTTAIILGYSLSLHTTDPKALKPSEHHARGLPHT
jgi:hypothetical protein